ncbi:MAG: hypothetical protein NT138_12550 [Planctomycetales bacterium]|nr:hypothetical protein [Planctomycetales bacterium]
MKKNAAPFKNGSTGIDSIFIENELEHAPDSNSFIEQSALREICLKLLAILKQLFLQTF